MRIQTTCSFLVAEFLGPKTLNLIGMVHLCMNIFTYPKDLKVTHSADKV